MNKYKCIIWDWNGTLLNDVDICVAIMNKLLKKRNMEFIDHEKYKEMFGFPVINYYEKLGFDFEKEPFENISVEFIELYQTAYTDSFLCDGGEAILKYIKDKGISQVILSASQEEHLRAQVSQFGITEHFDKILGLNHCHATSKIEIGRQWLQATEYNNNEILLIGDTLHDYEVAEALGCDCILVSSGHQSRDRIGSLGVPVIDSFEDLKQYI